MKLKRQQFNSKLFHIHRALCEYTKNKLSADDFYLLPDMSLRYAIILKAVEDLYYGNFDEQQNALEYFNSATYTGHCDESAVEKEIMDMIISNPESYSDNINYDLPYIPYDREYLESWDDYDGWR